MSRDSCKKCSSSASDGNLADMDAESFENQIGHRTCEIQPSNIGYEDDDRQVFFTLPRWMSGRRKSRRKIKDIKVDVPFKATSAEENNTKILYEPLVSSKNSKKKKPDKAPNIFKIFKRSLSFIATNTNSIEPVISATVSKSVVVENANPKQVVTNHHKIPRTPPAPTRVISASNTDIRSQAQVPEAVDCQEYFKGKTPAICGLKNHGNTCFMNAVLQCLSSTDSFAEYFVLDQYKVDFVRRNKVHSKKYGTKGEVTEQLATLLKSLWSCQHCPDVSYKFKCLVGKYGSQYEGSDQHDAQEFLLWLLDKVHEDLNTAPKQKYKKPKNNFGRPDEDLAAETMAIHLRCNNSFIHDLFQGQLRSSLSCPACGQCSNTFDPYLCVSLPVPHVQTVVLFIHLVLFDKDTVLKIGLTVDLQATVLNVKEKIGVNHSIAKQRLILTEYKTGSFPRTFSDTDPVSSLKEANELYAFELPLSKASNNSEGEQMTLIVVNRILEGEEKKETFWKPLVVQVSREANFKAIQEQILRAMSSIVKESINVDNPLFKLRVIDGVPVHEVLPQSVDLPLYMPVVDQALSLGHSFFKTGPKHLKLTAEWQRDVIKKLFNEKEFVEEDSSALNLSAENKVPTATLYECFDMYFTEEKLGIDDAWMCPFCHRRLQGVKQLSLWTVPDAFIVHLKRFRQNYCQRTKVTTLVEFPLASLDMNPYIVSRNSDSHSQATNNSISQMATWSPWKRPKNRLFHRCEDNVYDLYAVCNHHGSMQGGHYTAYCKNLVDGKWYLYDDDRVQQVQDSEVMTANAYMLFYQRSSFSTHSCASSSTSGYSSASSGSLLASDHWAFRMLPFIHFTPKTSKSQDNLCNIILGSATLDSRRTSENRPFTRSARSYSSMMQFSDYNKSTPAVCHNDSESQIDRDISVASVPPPPPPPAKRYWTITSV